MDNEPSTLNTTHTTMQLRFVAGCIPILLLLPQQPCSSVSVIAHPATTTASIASTWPTANSLHQLPQESWDTTCFPRAVWRNENGLIRSKRHCARPSKRPVSRVKSSIPSRNRMHFGTCSASKRSTMIEKKDQRERVWVPYENISHFEPITKDTKRLIKHVKHLYKHKDVVAVTVVAVATVNKLKENKRKK